MNMDAESINFEGIYQIDMLGKFVMVPHSKPRRPDCLGTGESNDAGVLTNSSREPEAKDKSPLEIGEFGEGRPDFGGRKRGEEAHSAKKKRAPGG